MKATPSLCWPETSTTTSPVAAPSGTVAVIEVALQRVVAARFPLKVTLLVPFVAPKWLPVIATDVPTGPEVGFKPLITGFGITVKATPSLCWAKTVTTTSPVAAPSGTVAVIEVALQRVVAACLPLKVTLLYSFVAPKWLPVISTDVPTGPEVGFKLLITGLGITVKTIPLLD